MISAFLNPIFPVFAIMLVGIIFARAGLFDRDAAQAINRFVFYAAVPSLLILLLSQADLGTVDLRFLGLYFLAEVTLFVGGAVILHLLFKCGLAESILLGMASCFVNHVFFILPIATILYGQQSVAPISAIIVMDTTIIFGGAIVGLEIASHRSESRFEVLRSFLKNPVLLSIAAGLAINGMGIRLHEGIITFTDFVGSAAAPAALFSLGIILAQRRLLTLDYVAIMVTLLKVIGHPLVAWALFSSFMILDPIVRDPILLVAAGPCGAMPFVLAMQYKVRTESIGLAIIYSTVASLATLSLIA